MNHRFQVSPRFCAAKARAYNAVLHVLSVWFLRYIPLSETSSENSSKREKADKVSDKDCDKGGTEAGAVFSYTVAAHMSSSGVMRPYQGPLERCGLPIIIVFCGSTLFATMAADPAIPVTSIAPPTAKSLVPDPPLTRSPAEVVVGLPIFQGGRIPRGEHAYVGDIWMIKNGRSAVMIDSGSVSGVSFTQARLRALGVERVTHVLHTHTHGDHCGGAYLWRARGAQMVGAKSAALALSWLMPMLTDYGVYPPRPLDLPLPLAQAGDEADFAVSGLKFRALFVPGHSFDLTIYMMELGGRRIAFTGDLGFENQDILHRCWGDADKARAVVRVVRDRLLAWQPEIVFTGHGVRPNGTEFVAMLVRRTEESLQQLAEPAPPARP